MSEKAEKLMSVLSDMDEESLIEVFQAAFNTYDYPILSMCVSDISIDEKHDVLLTYQALIYPDEYFNQGCWEEKFSSLLVEKNTLRFETNHEQLNNSDDTESLYIQLHAELDSYDILVDDECVDGSVLQCWRDIVMERLGSYDAEEFLDDLPESPNSELLHLCKKIVSSESQKNSVFNLTVNSRTPFLVIPEVKIPEIASLVGDGAVIISATFYRTGGGGAMTYTHGYADKVMEKNKQLQARIDNLKALGHLVSSVEGVFAGNELSEAKSLNVALFNIDEKSAIDLIEDLSDVGVIIGQDCIPHIYPTPIHLL